MRADLNYIKKTISLAHESMDNGGFPNGALIVFNNSIVGEGRSLAETNPDPTAHAEVTAIRHAAAKLGASQIDGGILYTSLEPCLMCLHSAYWAGIVKIVYAARKEKVNSSCYEGSCSTEYAQKHFDKEILLDFYSELELDVVKLHEKWEESITIASKLCTA